MYFSQRFNKKRILIIEDVYFFELLYANGILFFFGGGDTLILILLLNDLITLHRKTKQSSADCDRSWCTVLSGPVLPPYHCWGEKNNEYSDFTASVNHPIFLSQAVINDLFEEYVTQHNSVWVIGETGLLCINIHAVRGEHNSWQCPVTVTSVSVLLALFCSGSRESLG